MTDQQRWDTTGIHGNPLDLTPNFDRVARSGTHLLRSFTCQPLCGPARSSLQTGQYATNTGCFRNGIPLPQHKRTLAHYFREKDYKTGYIGKWHLADEDPVPEVQRGGYEYWLASNILERTSDPYHTTLYDNDNKPTSLPGYRVDALTDAAIRYINLHKDDNFYLFLSFLEPHHQNRLDYYPAPDGYRERYSGYWVPPDLSALGGSTHRHIGGYYGMVKRLDEALGRLLDALKSLDLTSRTILLFTSDHGCHFKTRNTEYKRSCHEASIRVPTALTGPMFDGGGQVRRMVSIVDLAPTLLHATGISVSEEIQGRSILPLLADDKEGWPEEMFVQISEVQVERAVRTQRWKYSVVAPNKDGSNDADSDQYVEKYLYDLHVDPYELDNLVGLESHREVAEVMRERLLRRMSEAGERETTIELAPERATTSHLQVYSDEVYG